MLISPSPPSSSIPAVSPDKDDGEAEGGSDSDEDDGDAEGGSDSDGEADPVVGEILGKREGMSEGADDIDGKSMVPLLEDPLPFSPEVDPTPDNPLPLSPPSLALLLEEPMSLLSRPDESLPSLSDPVIDEDPSSPPEPDPLELELLLSVLFAP